MVAHCDWNGRSEMPVDGAVRFFEPNHVKKKKQEKRETEKRKQTSQNTEVSQGGVEKFADGRHARRKLRVEKPQTLGAERKTLGSVDNVLAAPCRRRRPRHCTHRNSLACTPRHRRVTLLHARSLFHETTKKERKRKHNDNHHNTKKKQNCVNDITT